MLKKKGLPPVSGEVVILTLCLVLVLITLSQILVVHHKFNGRYTKVVRPRGPRARQELRQLERSLASLMRQHVPSMQQHSEQLRTEVFANRISQIIQQSALESGVNVNATRPVLHRTDYSDRLNKPIFPSSMHTEHGVHNAVCAVVPSSLTGPVHVNVSHSHDDISLSSVIRDNKQIEYGGRWQPSVCRARYRVAIVVPYRDRLQHLATLLSHLFPVLRRQQLNFRVFVVEQGICDQIAKLTLTTSEIYKRTEKLQIIETKIGTIENTLHELSTSVKSAHDRISKVEDSCQFISNTFDAINTERNEIKHSIDDLQKNMKIAQEDICYLSKNIYDLQDENDRLHDEVLYLQTRSMRFNPLFYGIPDKGQGEDTEQVLTSFLAKEIDIVNAPIQVSHRLGPYREFQRKPKTIVGHFEKIRDKEITKRAAKKLAGKPYGIGDQFPQEIAERKK
ncbi:uncharacterized protein LOC121370233 [Gigantopelta aegis]|uniref:uncharacterized protein LOC121370233 n=1 Tax=Gigantopelta aegis TaxID=1735272 RepID=UPI001B88A3E0|nr:uncharacterized protein LOC121370233 [Gigantopelta aegis]